MLAGDVAHELQVAGAVLLVAERAEHELAGGVIDAAHEGEHALARHTLAPAAVSGCSPLPWAGHAGGAEDAPHGRTAERDALALGEQLGEVAVGGTTMVVAPGQRHDPRSGVRVDAAWAGPAAVAVGEGRGALGEQASPQAPGLPGRDAEPLRRLLDGQVTPAEVGQDAAPSLFFDGQADHVSHVGRLTKSLISPH
jgi:hypothetical protein